MTNELADLKKLQLQRVFALKAGGWKLKYALKSVGMSYTTYRRALAACPNLITDLILEQYKIDLNQFIQVTRKRRDRLQGLSARLDTGSRMPKEDLDALNRRLTAIRAEMKSQRHIVTWPPR
jgi:hypothetical protein